jgi:predicted DCC family thiol-disulfide oxidoreductase YuxK
VTAPDPSDPAPAAGWLCYDANCGFCTRTARRVEPVIARRGFGLIPLQTPWVREHLGLAADAPLREMVVLTPDGRHFGGADGAVHLARAVWWARPLVWFAALPGGRALLRRLYAAVARRRSCAHGTCPLPASRHSSS